MAISSDSQSAAKPPGNPRSGAKLAPVRKRHDTIKKMVQAQGFVTIESLARAFEVTPQTIRRDINALSKSGHLRRYHGGAAMLTSAENVAYTQRKVMYLKEKQLIARMVAAQIPNNASLFINIGTTTEEIAKCLCDHDRLRIITNNLNVATILSGSENFEVIVASGLVRPRDGGIVGPLTIDFIQQFRVDYGIIGISGIDLDGTLLDFDYREVRAARAIIDNSRKVFLAADHSKFGRNALVRLGNIAEIDALFTDRPLAEPLAEVLAATDVELHVAAKKPRRGAASRRVVSTPGECLPKIG
jgi:DeoR family glycerol-3-phosphate regulon repressor